MSAMDDLRTEVAAADTLMDQAAVFVTGTPAVTAAAVAAQKAGDEAGAAAIMADLKAHADPLGVALAAGVTPTTPPIVVPLPA